MIRNIVFCGTSVYVNIPKQYVELLKLHKGQCASIELVDGKIVITPLPEAHDV